jgi:hypothetical protein
MDWSETDGGVVDAYGTPVSIRHPDLQRLFAYWRANRGRQEFPRRADLDPVDFGFMLDRVALTEVHDEKTRRYRLRVVGSWWTNMLGFEPTGMWMDAWPNPGQLELTVTSYESLIALRRPVLGIRDAWVDQRKLSYEILLLPLSEDGLRVSMIMTGIGPRRP